MRGHILTTRLPWTNRGHSLLLRCCEPSFGFARYNLHLSTALAHFTSELRNFLLKIFSRASLRGQTDPPILDSIIFPFYHTSLGGKSRQRNLFFVIINTKEKGPQADLHTLYNPNQHLARVFGGTLYKLFQLSWKRRCSNVSKNILRKNNVGETLVLPDVKTHNKAAVTKLVWYWYSDGQNADKAISRNRPMYVDTCGIK